MIMLMMNHFSTTSSRFLPSCFFISSLLQSILSGLAAHDGFSDSGNDAKVESHTKSKASVGLTVFLVILGLICVVAVSVFLFKAWQKKKRNEQQVAKAL